jgi:phosphoribosylformylglycinamidine cyclo-ligase
MATAVDNLSYKDAGVDIDAGNLLVEHIKTVAKTTCRPEMLAGIGGFSSLFAVDIGKYRHPVMVSSTDGVGTKIMLCGAEPQFFLDYFASGQLRLVSAEDIITGIAEGCRQANMALVGGETAEMPGLYRNNDYDLAGFSVGLVEKDRIIDGKRVKPGDILLGLASSGPHSNGFSLIRKIIEKCGVGLDTLVDGQPLGTTLLTPTRIYVRSILSLLERYSVHAMAHITGGGLLENIPRVLPPHCQAVIDPSSWQWPPIFTWLQEHGPVAREEMYRTFNCGIGMVICVSAAEVNQCVELLKGNGEQVSIIGEIKAHSEVTPPVLML